MQKFLCTVSAHDTPTHTKMSHVHESRYSSFNIQLEYFAISPLAVSMYFFSAFSLVVPWSSFHLSHLYLPFKSNIPGRAVLQSPTVACLNQAYSSSSSSLVGRTVSCLTSSAAFSNSGLLLMAMATFLATTCTCQLTD